MSHRNRFLTAALLAALFAPAMPVAPAKADPVVAGEKHCVVNVRSDDVLNIRAAPGAGQPIVAGKRYGECGVRATGECLGSWCPVEDGDLAGWMHHRYIAMVSPALYCVSGVAADDVLNLRAYPSPQSKILAALEPDQCDIAFLPYAVKNWQKIRVAGSEGWVNRNYLSGE